MDERVTDQWIEETIEQHQINPMAWFDNRKVVMALRELQQYRTIEMLEQEHAELYSED